MPVSGSAATTRPATAERPRVIVIMGVAGSGKTTVGQALAAEVGWAFRDADEFHSAANIAKMAAGVPLTDDDRQPWLASIRAFIDGALAGGGGAVVTCSALKQRYRDVLVADPRVRLVHLSGDFAVILERMRQRQGHFMRPEMLRSQFEALEAPADALCLDVRHSVPELVAQIRRAFFAPPFGSR